MVWILVEVQVVVKLVLAVGRSNCLMNLIGPKVSSNCRCRHHEWGRCKTIEVASSICPNSMGSDCAAMIQGPAAAALEASAMIRCL